MAVLALTPVMILAGAGCFGTERTSESARNEVVQLVQAGTLSVPDRDVARVGLPSGLRHTSVGGEVIVSRLNGGLDLVFFAKPGVLDSWEGYVYAEECQLDDDPLGGVLSEVQALGSCWFYAVAH